MLTVNWKPVAIALPPLPSLKTVGRQRPRLWRGGTAVAADGCPPSGACDRRVWKGSNFSRQPTVRVAKSGGKKRPRPAGNGLECGDGMEAVAGRRHADAQSNDPSASWETTIMRTAATATAAQTDLTPGNLRPPEVSSVAVVKYKTGLDASTQVGAGELSDFDEEAQPVCEALVAGTLEMAAVHVLYEDDMAALRRIQDGYLDMRRARRVELDRLEHAEDARRRKAIDALAEAERAAPDGAYRAIHGRALAARHMAGLLADAVGQLASANYLHIADNEFTAWLFDRLRGQFRGRVNANDRLMRNLVGGVIANRPRVDENSVLK